MISPNTSPLQGPLQHCIGHLDISFVSLGSAKVAALGVVQGISELLPISSTAHVRVIPAFLGATVYAADVFGGKPTGGSALEIALALNWLAENNVAVVNISLAGPPNAILSAAVKAFVASGHVLVAATGNDGPAAPPNYPAAYPGVLGVTASNAQHHLALESNPTAARFAALGVDVEAAALPAGYNRVSGSSFASPLVAARFAPLIPTPDQLKCQPALEVLSRQSVPLADSRIGYLAPPPSEVAQR